MGRCRSHRFCLCPTVCLSADVAQTPGLVLVPPGANVTLECEHPDSGFLYKFWYRQEKNRPLTLIGSTYSTQSPNMEREFGSNRTIIEPKTAERSLLLILTVSGRDSATYYCASSTHSATGRGAPCAELGDPPHPVTGGAE
uniref:Ig-like domain-containing protein n=1 Tax=Xenopus tropicalis TaxID=8364 RepID=A0A6I8RJ74_XENTR